MRASHRISVAIGLSLLAHASLLLVKTPAPAFTPPGPLADVPMTVMITPAEAPREPVPEPPPVTQLPPPAARPRATPPPRRVAPVPAAPLPPVAAPQPPAIRTPRGLAPPPVDMLAAIEARREARRAAEAESRAPPAVDQPAEDAATRNLRTLSGREGVGGVFQVLHLGSCSGEFAFNGWRPDARSQWREVIAVQAKCGEVQLAMIKRMIELIRTHYTGDFNWESHRLGRVVVLSARPGEQQELEDFLLKEFFGTQVLNPRR